jgi:predicted MFS family arabinose efflux permease
LPAGEEFVSWREFFGNVDRAQLALVCLAVWLHAADSLVVATMLPAMVAEIGGQAFVGWTFALYEIGSIVAGAASALLVMRRGLRLPMAAAAGLFALGCAVSALAPAMPEVLAGRVMQGLGGGGLVSMAFVAINAVFPGRYVARAMAALSALWGVSAFLGPLIGGFFVEHASWRGGFWFFAAQALVLCLWISVFADPRPLGAVAEARKFPLKRLALLCAAILSVASGGISVAPLRTTLFVVGGLACLGLFLRNDRRAGEDRLLPADAVDPRGVAGATLLMILAFSMATIAITAFGPILITAIHGTPALTVGYIIACSSIGWTVLAVAVSGAPARLDGMMVAAGMAMTTVSILIFLYAVPNGPVWLIAVAAFLEGGGFGIAWTFVIRRATALAREGDAARLAGAIPTVSRLGYALGAAYLGIVANASGFLAMETPAEAAFVAKVIFLSCLPLAAIGFWALCGFMRAGPGRR